MLSPCSILSNNISIVSTLRKMLERQVENKTHSSTALSRFRSLKIQSSTIKSELLSLKILVQCTSFSTIVPPQYRHLLVKPQNKRVHKQEQISFDDKQNRVTPNINFNIDTTRNYTSKFMHHSKTTDKQNNHTLRSRIFKDLADLKKIEEKEKFIRDSSQIKGRKTETEYKRRPLEDILMINETRSVNHSHNTSRDETFITQSLDSRLVQSIITPLQNSNIVVPQLRKSTTIHPNSLLCGCNHEYYSGDILHGKPHGKGRLYACCEKSVLKLSQGAEFYSGGFCEGRMEGYGTLTFKNGTKFVGMFKGGLRHGDGSIYYKGSVEMGKWCLGKLAEKM